MHGFYITDYMETDRTKSSTLRVTREIARERGTCARHAASAAAPASVKPRPRTSTVAIVASPHRSRYAVSSVWRHPVVFEEDEQEKEAEEEEEEEEEQEKEAEEEQE